MEFIDERIMQQEATDSQVVNIFINSQLALVLQAILFVVELCNILLYLPLVYVSCPAHTQYFYELLLRIASKDLIDVGAINRSIWKGDLEEEQN